MHWVSICPHFSSLRRGRRRLHLPLTFSSAQSGPVNGEGGSAEFIVYDSLGAAISVRVTTVLEQTNSAEEKFRYIATSADNEPEKGYNTVVGTGVITTDGEGNIISASNDRIAVERRQSPAASPLEFQLDFSQVTGLAGGVNELSASRQDGFAAGTLSSFIITETGRIQGVFSNGASRRPGPDTDGAVCQHIGSCSRSATTCSPPA